VQPFTPDCLQRQSGQHPELLERLNLVAIGQKRTSGLGIQPARKSERFCNSISILNSIFWQTRDNQYRLFCPWKTQYLLTPFIENTQKPMAGKHLRRTPAMPLPHQAAPVTPAHPLAMTAIRQDYSKAHHVSY
jgi:hypothetical protein